MTSRYKVAYKPKNVVRFNKSNAFSNDTTVVSKRRKQMKL